MRTGSSSSGQRWARGRRAFGVLMLQLGLATPVTAHASGQRRGDPGPVIPAPMMADAQTRPARATGSPGSPSPVRWPEALPRVRWWEYAGAGTLLAAAFVLRFAGPSPPDNWRGGILLDDAVLDAIAIDDPSLAEGVTEMTDVLFYGAMAYRLVDSALVPLIGHGQADLALQLSMIDLVAFSTQAIILWGSQALVGRTRPIVLRCENDGGDADRCDVPSRLGERRSFIAGHPATGMTAAGLTCQHHRHIPLYGGWGDPAACATTLVAAVVNGIGRVVTEQHYPSDLVLGLALGTFSGWVVPALLHYGFGPSVAPAAPPGEAPPHTLRATLLPLVGPNRLGLGVGGVF